MNLSPVLGIADLFFQIVIVCVFIGCVRDVSILATITEQ